MARTIGVKSAGSKTMTIGIDGTTLAIRVSTQLWLHLTPRITYRTRSPAAPIWTITANGSIPTNMAGCGVHAGSALTGRLIATVIGDGFRHMAAGRGFRMSRGAGRLIITGDGPMCGTAGAGRRSPTATRDSGGDDDRDYRGGDHDGYWKGFRDGRYGWLGWCPLSPRDRRYGPRENPPRLEALGNFRAPRGVSGMDARRFTDGRVRVSRELLNAPVPPRGEMNGRPRGEKDFAAAAFVRNEDLKPLQRITPTRSDAVARGRFARRIETPIIFRHSPGSVVTPGSRPNRQEGPRDGQRTPPPFRRDADSNPPAPTRSPNGRIEAPSRPPDSRP